jgi:2-polyprenyl-3-methyl-5-hydroxy-6-metoxy-1,4-benzoquinol methylase
MSDQTVSEETRKFYEQFPFPGTRPIDRDGLMFMRRFMESIERARGITTGRLRVLDAGCGTGNTTLSLARRFSDVEFTGLDNSRTSLALATASAAAHALPNLAYRRWNLTHPLPRTKRFDIILCLGVLHHTADMRRVLRNLCRALTDNGELYLWVYGKHGRYRHTLNVRLLSMLLKTKPAPTDTVKFARDFIHNAGNGTVLIDIAGGEARSMEKTVFEDPVWIADQFLNPVERLLDMKGLLSLVSSSGLSIAHTLGLNDDPEKNFVSDGLRTRFAQLSKDRRLIALDLLLKPERYFVLLRRPRKEK